MMPKQAFVLFFLFSFTFLSSAQIIQPQTNDERIERIDTTRISVNQNLEQIDKIVFQDALTEDQQDKTQLPDFSNVGAIFKPKFDKYKLANTIFNSQKTFGGFCDRCKKLEYFAFRIGKRYLTARPASLAFQSNNSPANSQLFTGQQQVDGTWAFKSLTQKRYIRADDATNSISYRTFVSPSERWYLERGANNVFVQSAQFERKYWIISGGALKLLKNGASPLIVQHWPKLGFKWNV